MEKSKYAVLGRFFSESVQPRYYLSTFIGSPNVGSLHGSQSIWGRELARKAGDGWELKDRLQGLVRLLNVSRALVDRN